MTHVRARAVNGTDMTIEGAAIAGLATSLRGRVLLEDDDGYDTARTLWNGMIDRRPALIARCLGVADVVACVDFPREQGVLVSVKSGGHSIAGLALADGALGK